MQALIRPYGILLIVLWNLSITKAQDLSTTGSSTLDFAEFNKRAILPVEAGMGFSSQSSKSLFTVQISPQATVVNHHLRIGATVGAAYTALSPDQQSDQWTVYAGPKVAYKLKQFEFILSGLPQGIVYGNLNVFLEHLWGANNVKLLGAALRSKPLKKRLYPSNFIGIMGISPHGGS